MPLILLERLCGGGGKIMVAQPRRIAAYGLYQRAKQMGAAGGKVGLRMGHDTRLEEQGTRLWYMTTGYLTRLASYRPEAIGERGVEFLVLDECHERSIEADVRRGPPADLPPISPHRGRRAPRHACSPSGASRPSLLLGRRGGLLLTPPRARASRAA